MPVCRRGQTRETRRGRGRSILLAVLSVLLLVPVVSHADVVLLTNGESVRGKILAMEDQSLEVETDFAGKIRIDWAKVQGLTSDRPLSLNFHATSDIPEGIGLRDGDRLIVTQLQAGGPIRLRDIKAINATELYYRGYASAGGNQTTGNSRTQALNLTGSFTLRRDRDRLQIDARYIRGEAEGELTAQNARGSSRYDYFLSRQTFLFGDQLLEYDLFQNLELRSTSAVGLGYDVFDRKTRSLSFGGGPTFVYEDFTTEPATATPSAMWFVRWYQEFRGGDVRIFHKHQGFQDYGTRDGFRLNASQGIRVKVFGDFSLNLEYDIRYNTQPAPGRKELDTTLIIGFAYEIER